MALPSGPVAAATETEAALFDLVDRYDRAYEKAAATVSLSPAQACLLGRLDEQRGMGALAHELGCDASNITQIVTRLEALGLIEREPSPHDRRARLVGRTTRGQDVNQRFEEAFAFAREATGRLSPHERVELGRLVRKALG